MHWESSRSRAPSFASSVAPTPWKLPVHRLAATQAQHCSTSSPTTHAPNLRTYPAANPPLSCFLFFFHSLPRQTSTPSVPPLHHRIHFPVPHTLSITHRPSPPARARHTVRPVTRPLSDSPRPVTPTTHHEHLSSSSPTCRLYPLLNAAAPTFTIAVRFLSTLHPSNHSIKPAIQGPVQQPAIARPPSFYRKR
jgi:hypothetical protein